MCNSYLKRKGGYCEFFIGLCFRVLMALSLLDCSMIGQNPNKRKFVNFLSK